MAAQNPSGRVFNIYRLLEIEPDSEADPSGIDRAGGCQKSVLSIGCAQIFKVYEIRAEAINVGIQYIVELSHGPEPVTLAKFELTTDAKIEQELLRPVTRVSR